MRLTAVCVLKTGGHYDAMWVRRLRRQVAEHLHVPHRFVCLTDAHADFGADVDAAPLLDDLPGYWAKVELFRPGLFSGRVLYLDLDTLVTGDITPLAEYRGSFAALADWWKAGAQSSAVLLFDGRDPPPLYELFVATRRSIRVRRNARFDLWWNQQVVADEIQAMWPRMVASYKKHGLADGPSGFSIIDFHGKPGPDELPGTWVEEHWRAA